MGAATTIVNAKVFDGTKSQDWTSVRFSDGLITKCSVASAVQEGDEVIDAGGGTVQLILDWFRRRLGDDGNAPGPG